MMAISIPNPYTGEDDETCSVSFQAQQQMAAGVGSPQTEAQYNASKLKGELGVMKAKVNLGIIPNGTKVFAFEGPSGTRGYYFVKGKQLKERSFGPDGKIFSKEANTSFASAEYLVDSGKYKVSIPQSVSPKPKPEPVPITAPDLVKLANLDPPTIPDGKVVAVKASGEYVKWNANEQMFQLMVPEPNGFGLIMQEEATYADELIGVNKGWLKPDGKDSTPNVKPATTTPPPAPTQVAAPMPTTAVNAGSTSVGSMSHEDVSAMFVKIKDDLAKEKGLNIKGANAALDDEVYKAIGNATGYAAAEVKAKIDAYKAAGNKLSALKKKVLAGTKKVPNGKPQPTKAASPSTPLVVPSASKYLKVDYLAPAQAAKEANKIKGTTQNEQFIKNALEAKAEFGNHSVGLVVKGDGGDIIGAMNLVDHIKDAEEEGLSPYMLIDYVGSEAGSGSAKAMITEAIKIAKNKKGILLAEPTQSSITYWQKQGFVEDPLGEGSSFFGLDEKGMDKWLADNPATPAPAPKTDPKPHGVPTVATPAVTNAVKQEVKQEAEANPGKVYSDEDISSAYIIAKDKVVAASNGKWTLYSKNDELDALIFAQIKAKTGFDKAKAQIAIANYLASGKKLSQLKKALAKQGAFKPEADTLKKSGAAKTQSEKDAEVTAKADAGYTPTPTPAAGTPPVDTGKPMPKSAGEKAREAGDISGLPASVKAEVYSVFKSTGSLSYLSAKNESTYEALVKTQLAMKANNHDLTLLQILRIVDEEGAKKFGAENGHLFEKKTATWLTTPSGTAYVKSYEQKLAKLAEEVKLKAEAEKLAKELENNQPPLPADSNSFQELSLDEAKKLGNEWLAARPWTAKEKRDLKYYTGSAYTQMNGYLRGLQSSIDERGKHAIDGARKGMRPTTKPLLMKRGTGLDQFKSLGLGRTDGASLWGITGKTFKDEGFLSTSAGGRAAFGGAARLEVECPVGTPMAYVAPISKYPHENEMLLQAGMEYKVLNIRKENGTFIVRVRVVNWPGKVN
jgi:hypothetical protein